jgi:hypothetical protein
LLKAGATCAATPSPSAEGKRVAASAAVSSPAAADAVHSPFTSTYHIPLRVHLGGSGRAPREFEPIFGEINDIYLSQAGICFEIEAVMHDEAARQGMDIWFVPEIGKCDDCNGLYEGIHSIQVRDTPLLRPAERPARHPAARTAAHEFGHGLGLSHRQDSDDNLMRSKTYGWQMNEEEVRTARKAAAGMSLPNRGERGCGPAVFRP